MTIKTLWLIILKTFGLYVAIQTIPVFFQFIAGVVTMAGMAGPGMFGFLMVPLLLFTIYLLLFLALIFKSEWLINKLKLDQGFNQEIIDLRFDFGKVVNIVVIFLGLWLLTDGLPLFVQGTVNPAPSTGVLLPIIKIAMGIVLIVCYPAISKLIVSRNNKEGL